jgi:hypothetical protein
MRPQSVVNFERVVLFSLLLAVVKSFMVWERLMAIVGVNGRSAGFIFATQAITCAIYLVLIWFTSRRGSPAAKWIYVVLAALGMLFGLFRIELEARMYGTPYLAITLIRYVLTAVSIWLLFRKDAKAWFRDGRGRVDTSIFK